MSRRRRRGSSGSPAAGPRRRDMAKPPCLIGARCELFAAGAFTAIFPTLSVPGLPFIGAYALQVTSPAAAEALLRGEGLAMRRIGASLMVPFPGELGVGAWLFAESAAGRPGAADRGTLWIGQGASIDRHRTKPRRNPRMALAGSNCSTRSSAPT